MQAKEPGDWIWATLVFIQNSKSKIENSNFTRFRKVDVLDGHFPKKCRRKNPTNAPVRQESSARAPKTTREGACAPLRDRRKQTLFIDARKLGTLIDRELTDADLQKITSTYHAWRSDSSIQNSKSKIQNSQETEP